MYITKIRFLLLSLIIEIFSFFFHKCLASREVQEADKKTHEQARKRSCEAESAVSWTVKLRNLTCGESSWNRLPPRHPALPIFTHATYEVSDFAQWWFLIARSLNGTQRILGARTSNVRSTAYWRVGDRIKYSNDFIISESIPRYANNINIFFNIWQVIVNKRWEISKLRSLWIQ